MIRCFAADVRRVSISKARSQARHTIGWGVVSLCDIDRTTSPTLQLVPAVMVSSEIARRITDRSPKRFGEMALIRETAVKRHLCEV